MDSEPWSRVVTVAIGTLAGRFDTFAVVVVVVLVVVVVVVVLRLLGGWSARVAVQCSAVQCSAEMGSVAGAGGRGGC